jgi:threonine dehydratase
MAGRKGKAAAAGRGVSAFATLVRRTPVVPWPERPGVWLKLENLQRTGSFKMRGAALALDALDADERRRGVVTASAGNHGLGVALAAHTLGIRAEVFVPETSPAVKREGIHRLGARVIAGGAGYDEAEAQARSWAERTGARFVSAFDDPYVAAGNGGTLAEEILEQVPGVKQIVVPVGGGGLAGGLAAVAQPRGVRTIGVQPEGNCAMHDSLVVGRALRDYVGEPTIAEGCEGATADFTYALCLVHGVKTVLVSERAILRALVMAYRFLGQAIEPTAAVPLAAIQGRKVRPVRSTVVVVSGGNVEPAFLSGVLGAWT